jgi:hypothetical protein
MTIIASFLAGSLLSLLMPVLLLIALVVWSMRYTRAIPEPVEGQDQAAVPSTLETGAADAPEMSHTPGEA